MLRFKQFLLEKEETEKPEEESHFGETMHKAAETAGSAGLYDIAGEAIGKVSKVGGKLAGPVGNLASGDVVGALASVAGGPVSAAWGALNLGQQEIKGGDTPTPYAIEKGNKEDELEAMALGVNPEKIEDFKVTSKTPVGVQRYLYNRKVQSDETMRNAEFNNAESTTAKTKVDDTTRMA